ncbi:universal stress protein [Actinomyces sp. oral taxon 897]|nr:universal stress protein [Actinomyces sp. oral taxon 897]
MTYTTIVAGVGDLTDNAHVIDRACEMARLCDATLLLVAGFDPVSARDKARVADTAQVADVRVNEVQLTEDKAYAVVEKARDIAVERGVGLAQGVVVEGEAVSALTLVAIETQADLVVVGSRGVDSLLGRLFGAVSIQVLRKSRCDVLVVVEPDAASDSAAALRAAANSVAAAAVDTAVAHVVATDAAAKTAGKPAD